MRVRMHMHSCPACSTTGDKLRGQLRAERKAHEAELAEARNALIEERARRMQLQASRAGGREGCSKLRCQPMVTCVGAHSQDRCDELLQRLAEGQA